MLHRHIVTLLYHRVLVINIATGTNHRLRAAWVVETSQALRLEALFASIEYHSVLQVLVTGLVVSSRPTTIFLIVLARPRDIELKTLVVMSFIETEPWRCCVEAHFFANHIFVVCGSCLSSPFKVKILLCEALALLLIPARQAVVPSIVDCKHRFFVAGDHVTSQQAHVDIGSVIGQVEAVGGRVENTVWFSALLRNRGLNARFGLFANDSQVRTLFG